MSQRSSSSGLESPSICAVVLAFSRPKLLRECIAGLRAQTRPLNEILVIDQSNIPEIHDWLDAQSDLAVVRQNNRGTAGGFGEGLRVACRRGHDWAWIFDDDGIPQPDALANLLRTPCANREDTGFLVSHIIHPSGVTQNVSIPTGVSEWYGAVLQDHCVRVSRASWLGLFIHTRAVRTCGLPIEEFFIWHDDQEYTERITRQWKGYCVLDSIIVHKQAGEAMDPFRPGDFFKLSRGLRNEYAWIRLSSASTTRIALRLARLTLRNVRDVLWGTLPVKSLPWIVRGLAFRPKPRQFRP